MSNQQSINATNTGTTLISGAFPLSSGVDKSPYGAVPWAALTAIAGTIAAIATQEKPAEAQITLGAGSTYSTIPGFNVNNPSATSSVFVGSNLTGLFTEDNGPFGGHQLMGPTSLTTALSNVTLLETTPGSGVFNFSSVVLPVVNTVGGVQKPFPSGEGLTAYFFSSAGTSTYSYSVNLSYSLLSTNIGTATAAGTSFTIEAITVNPFTALAGNYAEIAFAFESDGNTIAGITGSGIQGSSQTNFKQNIVGSTSETITAVNPLAVFMTAGGQSGGGINAPEPGSGVLFALVGGACAAIGMLRKYTAGKI